MNFSAHFRDSPTSPVLIAVPHAGRDYPPGADRLLRLSHEQLIRLEDRHADLLAGQAGGRGHDLIVAHTARAWIDLNRAPDDVDASMIAGGWPRARRIPSAKTRGGLGLIPRRIAEGGELWKGPLDPQDVAQRIETIHSPWHQAIARRLALLKKRFGVAILLDLHSMPTLGANRQGDPPPHIVIGTLHHASCDLAFADAVASEAALAGLRVAHNRPYAGGYTLERHGQPVSGTHAIQLEIDRALYLTRDARDPGPGLATMQAWVARVADTLAEEALGGMALAAE